MPPKINILGITPSNYFKLINDNRGNYHLKDARDNTGKKS